MKATTHVYAVYKAPRKIHLGRIFLIAATLCVLFVCMIKFGPTVLAIATMHDADDFGLLVDGQKLSIGEYEDSLGALQVHPKASVWVINHDPMNPAHVYKWTDSTKTDLSHVHFRAPLTSEGLYEIRSASQRRFIRLNWPN